jgi:hypothetical protein
VVAPVRQSKGKCVDLLEKLSNRTSGHRKSNQTFIYCYLITGEKKKKKKKILLFIIVVLRVIFCVSIYIPFFIATFRAVTTDI